jgi:hypothetical protein
MLHLGESFGASYTNIWDDKYTVFEAACDELAPRAQELAPRTVTPDADVKKWFWRSWWIGWLGFASFVVGVIGTPSNRYARDVDYTAEVLGILGVVLAAPVWLWFLVAWGEARKKQRKRHHEWLTQVGVRAALATVEDRQEAARSYDPDAERGNAPFTPGGPAPLPQPYGVSHEGAEALVTAWLRYLGESDAEATRFVGDGGIDVQSQHYIAQVKNYSGSVGVAEVRELGGVGSVDGRKPLFFTSGSYASGAVDFAERCGIALFIYDARLGTLVGANSVAESALARGL